MKQLITLLTTLIIQLTVFGQHDIGIKINGGLSYLDTKFHSNESVDKIYFQPSGQAGLFYNFHLRDKLHKLKAKNIGKFPRQTTSVIQLDCFGQKIFGDTFHILEFQFTLVTILKS